MKTRKQHKTLYSILYYGFLLSILGYIVTYQVQECRWYQQTQCVKRESINYDKFRTFELGPEWIAEGKKYDMAHVSNYIAYEMLSNNYQMKKKPYEFEPKIFRECMKIEDAEAYTELKDYYERILSDLKVYPVVEREDQSERTAFDNSWSAPRNYGGNRLHEGTDIMTTNNKAGYFPIVSITDGVVEEKGWLTLGGYRIGVRSEHGAYFYYAHLYDYAPNLEVGDTVKAGQLLGFMGDSGYGEEGTTGKFDVHLHLGIYIDSKLGEMSVNPYNILKYFKIHR